MVKSAKSTSSRPTKRQTCRAIQPSRHPYQKYEALPAWKVIDKAISDLITNQDLQLTTVDVYVVGYLVKSLSEAGLLENKTAK